MARTTAAFTVGPLYGAVRLANSFDPSANRRGSPGTSQDAVHVAYRSAVDADEVADELYALPPGQFTATRNARAREAKAAGDRETATRIATLRKPTVLAWLVNLLVRELPDEIGGFLDLGDALREATATLSGPELRQLSGQRHRIDCIDCATTMCETTGRSRRRLLRQSGQLQQRR